MLVVSNVRDHLTDTSTTDDIEVMAVAAAAKAQEYLNATTSSQKARLLQLEPATEGTEVCGQTDMEDHIQTEEEEEPVEPELPVSTLAPPINPPETDTEDDLFSSNKLSLPIQRQLQSQKETEQMSMIEEFDSN